MKAVLRSIYRGWLRFGRAVGHVNMLVLLTAIYVVILPVFSLVRFKDALRIGRRRRREPTHWLPMQATATDLESFYRPF